MRNLKRNITVFTIFVAVIFGVSSCSYQDPILKSFDGIEVIKMDGNKAEIELNFTMDNPNRQNIKLKNADFDVSINRIYIGKATLMEPTELPKHGAHKVNLKMNLELEKSIGELALSLGLAILTNSLEMQVKGTAKGSIGIWSKTFPINHSEKVNWDDLQQLNF